MKVAKGAKGELGTVGIGVLCWTTSSEMDKTLIYKFTK